MSDGLRNVHLKWMIATAAIGAFIGLSSYWVGVKANIAREAVQQARVEKIIVEHDPLMQRVRDEAVLNTMQEARITNLENSVSALVAKMDKLTDLLLEQHQREHRP